MVPITLFNAQSKILMMFWVNLDTVTTIWKLHHEDCRYCKPEETPNKGVNTMKRHGGWFQFETTSEAHLFYRQGGKNQIWQPCKVCSPVE